MRMAVPRMDAAHARAWIALLSTSQLLPAALDAQLTADGGVINFEFGILGALMAADDHTLRMTELAATIDSPLPRLSKAVTRLAGKGLVERVACPGDGRAVNVRLTRAGRLVWLKVTPPHLELARDRILAALEPDELDTLAGLLERITARLEPQVPTAPTV